MKLQDIEKSTLEEIVSHAIDGIKNRIDSGIYGYDLHSAVFNEDYYIIGRYEAEKWLNANGGVFYAIGEIKEYEESIFGQVTTDISEPEKVVNMFVYILGEIVLQESKQLAKRWNAKLAEVDMNIIIKQLEKLAA